MADTILSLFHYLFSLDGINSDPVTRCAIIFSALCHDADHRGVSNVQMGTEEKEMALLYENKSIAGKVYPGFS